MKISIIYHSESNNTRKIGEIIENSIKSSGEIETKLMEIENVDKEFLNDSKAVIFGSPVYYGTYSWKIKKWFDTTEFIGVDLADKLGGVFITEQFVGGGAEVAEMGLIGMMLIRGMLVYSAGGSKGLPFTHFGSVSVRSGDDFQIERAKIFGKRMAAKTKELFKDI